VPTTTKLQAKTLVPSVTANDMTKSVRFYTEGLGFAIQEEWKEEGVLKGVMLEAGKIMLGVSQDDFSKGKDRVKGVGARLHIETDQDIEALARQVKEAGFTLDSEPGKLAWGPVGFSVTDPDGFKLTISKPE
jgi:uncharacterized glyoxalase superfamily protein PhnB